jgi:hypothetical protein
MAEGGIPEYATVAELHDMTGTSKKTIYKHIEKASLKANGKKYQVQSVLSAIVKHRQEDKDVTKLKNDAPDYYTERARHEQFKADLAQLELKKKSGEMIPVDEVVKDWGQMITACRAKLLALPSKISPRLPGCDDVREMEQVIKSEILEALDELSGERVETVSERESVAKGS